MDSTASTLVAGAGTDQIAALGTARTRLRAVPQQPRRGRQALAGDGDPVEPHHRPRPVQRGHRHQELPAAGRRVPRLRPRDRGAALPARLPGPGGRADHHRLRDGRLAHHGAQARQRLLHRAQAVRRQAPARWRREVLGEGRRRGRRRQRLVDDAHHGADLLHRRAPAGIAGGRPRRRRRRAR